MEIKLKKKVDKPTIILGFPSLGLVGTIVSKFLIDHLDTEIIGAMRSESLTPMVAIHNAEIIDPITLHYNKKYNIIIIQSLSEVQGQEWETAKSLRELAVQLNAKETIIIEGMPSQENKVKTYHYSTTKKVVGKTTPLQEGLIGGLTAAYIITAKDLPMVSLFVEAHEGIPDTEAAAKVVETLDDYLGLALDPKPLLDQAKKFEKNLKTVLKQVKESKEQKPAGKPDAETIDYLG